MSNRRERVGQVLHRCADSGVAGGVDPWPVIKQRVEERAATEARRSRRARFIPNTRAGWAFAVLVTLLLASTGAYATAGIVDVLDDVFGETVPYVYEHRLGTSVGAKESKGGVTFTVDRIYADSAYVAVGYTVEGLDKPGKLPVDFSTDVELLEPEGVREYEIADAFSRQWAPGAKEPGPPKGSLVGTVVFEMSKMLEAGEKHRFRVVVETSGPADPVTRSAEAGTERMRAPFTLNLEVPVREAPVIDVNQTVESGGVPITLTEVVNSPAMTRAYLCFNPPQRAYDWPIVKTGVFEQPQLADSPVNHLGLGALKEGCATYVFDEALYGDPGVHSLTITELHASEPEEAHDPLKGPWRFRFNIPEPRLSDSRP